jgi:subtilisin family serine protease
MLRAPRVRKELGVTGEGVVVAMLDAGANYRHEDLRGNLRANAGEVPSNGEDDDGNGHVDDYHGFDLVRMRAEVLPDRIHHGTFASCVVAGDGTGGLVTGMAPRARIVLVEALGGLCFVARAHEYAVGNGADIMNLSFSVPGLGEARGLWRLMREYAVCAGLVLVSGAGNFPGLRVPEQRRVPKGIPCVICAGGATERKRSPRFLGGGRWSGRACRSMATTRCRRAWSSRRCADSRGPASV